MSIFSPFWAKNRPKTPKKAQNLEKAHWHDHITHVDGPSGDSGMSEELEGFWGICILVKNHENMWIYIGSPLWKYFFRFFSVFLNLFPEISVKTRRKDFRVKIRSPSDFLNLKSKWPVFTPQGAVWRELSNLAVKSPAQSAAIPAASKLAPKNTLFMLKKCVWKVFVLVLRLM